MNISQAGISLIKSFEGCRLVAYNPTGKEKYWTIGWGHYGKDVTEGEVWTQAQADRQLRIDLQKYVDGVNDAVKIPVNQHQFDALVSFAYNCGISALQKSTLLKYLNNHNFVRAAQEFNEFIHGSGQILPGLVRRRKAEVELFFKPVPKPKLAVHPYPGHVLKNGVKDKPNTRLIQHALGVKADGIFGAKTEAAVIAYQKKHHLVADGDVGKITWNSIF